MLNCFAVPETLSLREAADLLGLHQDTLKKMEANGEVTSIRKGKRREYKTEEILAINKGAYLFSYQFLPPKFLANFYNGWEGFGCRYGLIRQSDADDLKLGMTCVNPGIQFVSTHVPLVLGFQEIPDQGSKIIPSSIITLTNSGDTKFKFKYLEITPLGLGDSADLAGLEVYKLPLSDVNGLILEYYISPVNKNQRLTNCWIIVDDKLVEFDVK